MEWGAAIAALLGIILLVLKQWQANQPTRDQEQRNEEIQQGRADINNGDADAVSGRIDGLLSRQPLPAGQPGHPVTAERISAVSGLADSGRSTGADTGAGGSLPDDKG